MNVKAGDKVELIYGSGNVSKVAIVEGVTSKGVIKVSGMTFNPDGWQRGGDRWYKCYIKEITDERIEELKHEIFVRKIINKCQKINKLTYKQAVKINEVLNDGGDAE